MSRGVRDQSSLTESDWASTWRVLDQLPAALVFHDESGKMVRANSEAEAYLRSLVPASTNHDVDVAAPVELEQMVRDMAADGRRRSAGRLIAVDHNAALDSIDVTTVALPEGPASYCTVLQDSRRRATLGVESTPGVAMHEIGNLSSAACLLLAAMKSAEGDKNVRRMAALEQVVMSMYEVARQVSDHEVLRPIVVRNVVEELLVTFGSRFDELGTQVEVSVSSDLVALAAPNGFRQIGVNLCMNALRALAANGERKFKLDAGQSDHRVWLQFSNTAQPIANPETLFAPRMPGAEGSGLGLYISRMIARSFQGDLTYQYKKGQCQFRLSMPAWSE